MTKVEKLRDQTYKEAVSLLNEYGKCAIIRPTGFGKTGILTRFIRSGKYKKILYLYPSEVVKNTVLNFYYGNSKESIPDTITNVTFMTYMKLTQLNEKDFKALKDIDLIICDECHRLGASETMNGINELISTFPNVHLLGATATPERMDMIDEIAMFFDDRVTSKYTLHNAIQDGIIKKPYYVFNGYGSSDPETLAQIKKDARIEIDKIPDAQDRKYALELLNAKFIEVAKLHNMKRVIPETLEEANIDTNYQKYIVFFSGFSHIRRKKSEVKSWFKKAFPEHTIKELTITSETSEYRKNVNHLDELTYKDKHIDLIYSCDMLNMGYHVDNLTGVIMYRGTFSNIIYSQQLGRVLSTGNSMPNVVFDIVDNIHRKSLYSTLANSQASSALTEDELKEYNELVKRTNDKDSDGNPINLTDNEKERLIELSRKLKLMRDIEKGKIGTNAIYQSDLNVTKHTATYSEFIAKAEAEAISMRCRQAWARWIEKGGDASIMTKEYILSQKAPQKFLSHHSVD